MKITELSADIISSENLKETLINLVYESVQLADKITCKEDMEKNIQALTIVYEDNVKQRDNFNNLSQEDKETLVRNNKEASLLRLEEYLNEKKNIVVPLKEKINEVENLIKKMKGNDVKNFLNQILDVLYSDLKKLDDIKIIEERIKLFNNSTIEELTKEEITTLEFGVNLSKNMLHKAEKSKRIADTIIRDIKK